MPGTYKTKRGAEKYKVFAAIDAKVFIRLENYCNATGRPRREVVEAALREYLDGRAYDADQ